MKTLKRSIIVLVCMMFMVACGRKERIFLEKDGTLYTIGDQVAFYYPKNFEIDTTHEDKNKICFMGEDEILSFFTVLNQTENKLTEMPQLYVGELEEKGAVDVKYYDVTLESGIQCQSFTGMFQSSGIQFKHIVYFTEQATYSYCYEAVQDVYDENIVVMNQYLESLTIHRDRVALLE